MSDLAIIVVCLTLIVIAGIFSGTYYSINKVDPVEESRQRLRAAEDRFIETLKQPRKKDLWLPQEQQRPLVGEASWLEPEPEPIHEPDSMAPIPVDHDNPPKPLVYRRKGTAPIPNCTCHNRPLQEGQEILWWPVPDSTVVKVFCQRENS